MERISPTAIFFDYGNTLAEDTTDKYGDILRYTKSIGLPDLDKDRFNAGWKAAEAFSGSYRKAHGHLTKMEDRFWYQFCRDFLIGAFGEEAGKHAEDMWKTQFFTNTMYDDTIPTLKELKKRGYRLGVISNWEAPTLHDNFARFEMTEYFDHILPSYEAEAGKPHERIFNIALDALGVKPEESMHVGDSYGCDVIGALGVGIRPVWIEQNQTAPADKPDDLLVINTLSDLLNIVE